MISIGQLIAARSKKLRVVGANSSDTLLGTNDCGVVDGNNTEKRNRTYVKSITRQLTYLRHM